MRVLMIGKSTVMTVCEMHAHESGEIIFNLSGHGWESVGGTRHDFAPGSITLCPAHMEHDKHMDETGVPFQDIYLRFSDVGVLPEKPVWLNDDPAHRTEHLMQMILGLFYETPTNTPVIDKLFDALLALLLDRIAPEKKKSAITETINHAIIQRYADPGCDVQSIMARLNYADDYIRRVYKRDMQMTPHQYLLKVRLEHARSLLELRSTPHYSIREVALLSGFDDPNYFSRSFHRQMGVTPRAYRQSAE